MGSILCREQIHEAYYTKNGPKEQENYKDNYFNNVRGNKESRLKSFSLR